MVRLLPSVKLEHRINGNVQIIPVRLHNKLNQLSCRLRVHNTHEWYDLYRPHNQDELQKFFDRYTKGIDNGWERDTPRVRLSLLNYNGASPMIEERVEAEYPLSRTQYRKCFLDVGTLNLSDTIPGSEKNGSYDSESLTDTLVRLITVMNHNLMPVS